MQISLIKRFHEKYCHHVFPYLLEILPWKKEFSLNALFNVIWKGDSLWSASGRNFQGIPWMHSLMQLENELFVWVKFNTWIEAFVQLLDEWMYIKRRLSLIVQVNVVLNRAVVVDSDWCFDWRFNLCGSHLQSQSELCHISSWYYALVIDLWLVNYISMLLQQKYNWILKGWQVPPIKAHFRILCSCCYFGKPDPWSTYGSIDPDPTACDPSSQRCDPWSHPHFLLLIPDPIYLVTNLNGCFPIVSYQCVMSACY